MKHANWQTVGIFLAVLLVGALVIFVTTVNAPIDEDAEATIELTPVESTPDVAPSVTPTELPYTACAWVWASQSLPEITSALQSQADVLTDGGEVTISAQAFGENCLANESEINRFATMQTDFGITLTNIPVEQVPEIALQAVMLLQAFPVDETPGPNPGMVSLTVTNDGQMTPYRAEYNNVMDALSEGVSGEELLDRMSTR